mgnify:FL=1
MNRQIMKLFKYLLAVLLCIPGTTFATGYCARIPYTMSGGKMVVKAEINGKQGNFIFDTGAPVCLTYSFALGLELETLGKVRCQDSNGSLVDNRVVMLNCFRVGGIDFMGVQGMIMEEGNMVESFGVDGILGYSLFGDKIVEIDSRKKQITIAGNGEYFSLDTTAAIPMLLNSRVPLIEVKLSGRTVDTVMLDCGAGGFFDLSEKTYNRLQAEEVWTFLGRGRGILSLGAAGLEKFSLKYRVRIPGFTVGKGRFSDVVTKTTSGNNSRLGAEFLDYGIVTIDYRKRILYYRPFEEKVKNMNRKEWNVVITVMDNELKAGFVWESMWKDLQGGEKIIAVNGKRFDKVDAWQAMTTDLIGLSEEQAEIVVIGENGKEKKLIIRKE